MGSPFLSSGHGKTFPSASRAAPGTCLSPPPVHPQGWMPWGPDLLTWPHPLSSASASQTLQMVRPPEAGVSPASTSEPRCHFIASVTSCLAFHPCRPMSPRVTTTAPPHPLQTFAHHAATAFQSAPPGRRPLNSPTSPLPLRSRDQLHTLPPTQLSTLGTWRCHTPLHSTWKVHVVAGEFSDSQRPSPLPVCGNHSYDELCRLMLYCFVDRTVDPGSDNPGELDLIPGAYLSGSGAEQWGKSEIGSLMDLWSWGWLKAEEGHVRKS